MAKIKRHVDKYEPERCSCCGQPKTYILGMDQMTVQVMLALRQAVFNKNENCIHPRKEIEVDHNHSVADCIREGVMTSNMVGNLSRPRFHGLIAHVKDKPGYYCFTKKGSAFCHGEPIERYAIISKVEKRQVGYYIPNDDPGFYCTIQDFLGNSKELFLSPGYEEIEIKWGLKSIVRKLISLFD